MAEQIRPRRRMFSRQNSFGPKAGIMDNPNRIILDVDISSRQLSWSTRPQSVLVIKKKCENVTAAFIKICHWLVESWELEVYIEEKAAKDAEVAIALMNVGKIKINGHENNGIDDKSLEMPKKINTFSYNSADLSDKIDLIVCLGGDGTLLYASSLFQTSVPPVLAYHLGSLGFLMTHDFENFQTSLSRTLEGSASLTLRSRLHCTLTSENGHHVVKNHQVLNEVVVDRGPSPFICNLDLYVQDSCVTQVQGDGLIICTPTGSTAYAMAAGANMLHPALPALLLAPICPHSLSFRPVVLPAGVEVNIRPSNAARSTAWVSFDGRNRQELPKNYTLTIKASPFPVPCVANENPTSDWFASLADGLHWNVRKVQKAD